MMSNAEKKDFLLYELSAKISRYIENRQEYKTGVSGLTLYRFDEPTQPESNLYEPSICLVAQGSKCVQLGDEKYVYDVDNYLLTSVYLPTVSQVINASQDKPYLCLVLKFNLREMARIMADSSLPAPQSKQSHQGIVTGTSTVPLVDAFYRLISLLDTPEDIPFLASVIQTEIIYRLLVGEQGERLRQISSAGSQSNQIAQVLNWLRDNFAEQIGVEDLAKMAAMSVPSFYNHFRAMTSFSPLQYQKQLRLQEARRLMMAENLDASNASFQVGYESPSQFSREYSRLFGAPPKRDIAKLRRRIAH